MTNQTRNYRMFKKRIAVMDIYQEYRRSHERVKVMLSDELVNPSEQQISNPSAQENLQKFIKKYEVYPSSSESKTEEQNYVNFAEDTILPSIPVTDGNLTEMKTSTKNPPINSPINNEISSSNQNNFLNNNNNNNFDTFVDSEVTNRNTQSSNHKIESKLVHNTQFRNVEAELEDIVREALYNTQPNQNTKPADIDPELLNLMKDLLLKKELTSSDFQNYYLPNSDQISDDEIRTINEANPFQNDKNVMDSISSKPLSTNKDTSSRVKAEVLEKQIQSQQTPPKVPKPKNLVKPSGVNINFETAPPVVSSSEFEDDSSLAVTKKELSLQVKNLIKETLEDNKIETNKPNDLLELEKQLKEHIEKIKQSRIER